MFSVNVAESSTLGKTYVNRIYYFQGKNDAEVNEWIQAFQEAKKKPAPLVKTQTQKVVQAPSSTPKDKKQVILVTGTTTPKYPLLT